jgi:hypothetical protein
MAKKIIITFTDNIVIGDAFGYIIVINGLPVTYNSGVNEVRTVFIDTEQTKIPPQEINLSSPISLNIALVLNTLTTYFQYQLITYTANYDNNTITVLIDSNDVVIQFFSELNIGLSITSENVMPGDRLGLKYYLEYKNIIGDLYRCDIFKKEYSGNSLQIFGSVSLEKGSVTTLLDPIRGSGISLELEATKELTLEDLYTENEQDYTVKLYINNNLYFVGYLKPDGVFQDYVRDEWRINLDCIDGLGALKNLSFVDDEGFQILGKRSASEIIYRCLKRSGILLNINTSINILYDGLAASNNLDILTKTFINADRFVKVDDNTIMSCEEVLTSILDIFCAVITQKDGEWYIYKPNEFYLNTKPLFRRYNIDNVFIGTKVLNVEKSLGSQVDNFYPHHSGGNQKIRINGSVSAFRIGYKYGFVKGLLNNNNFYHTQAKEYEFWTIDQNNKFFYIIEDSLPNTGLKMKPDNTGVIRFIASSENVPLNLGDNFKLRVTTLANGNATFYYKVRLGNYYMDNNGRWSETSSFINSFIIGVTDYGSTNIYGSNTFQSEPLPITGNVYLEIYIPTTSGSPEFYATYSEITTIDIINTFSGDNKVGEFHTVQRAQKVSSIVKPNKEVYNGDNAGIVYFGAIFKEDQETLTSLWFRKGFIGTYPLLRISAEEELRIAQKPLKIFSGDIFGYIDYLSVINVNNIGDKFMPIEWNYDTKRNVTTVKLLELFAEEISDIKYTFTPDFGNTVKPTING